MPFIKMPDLEGKVFVPESDPEMRKKHPCKDCHFCQMCGDDRCALCKAQKEAHSKKFVCGSRAKCLQVAKKTESEPISLTRKNRL